MRTEMQLFHQTLESFFPQGGAAGVLLSQEFPLVCSRRVQFHFMMARRFLFAAEFRLERRSITEMGRHPLRW